MKTINKFRDDDPYGEEDWNYEHDFEEMVEDTRKKLEKKFKSKPEVIEGNLKAIERAYSEVKG